MLKFSKGLILSFFTILILFWSCQGSTENQAIVVSEVSNDFRSYPVDINASATRFSDLVDEVEIMRLEETEESLLSYVFRVSEMEGKYLFPGDNEGSIHTFSDQGQFLSKFNHSGDGPGEYNSIRTKWVEGDSIILYDGSKQVLNWYSLEGKHLKTLRIPERAAHVYPYEGGYALDMSFARISDSLSYQVLLTDKELNYQKLLLPYTHGVPFPISSSVNTFDRFGEELIFKSVFADTTYFIGAEGITPFYHIDFGDQYLWSDRSLYENGQVGMKAINEDKGVWIFKTYTGARHIFMTYNTSFQNFGTMLLHRETGQYAKVDNAKNVEERYSISPVGWMGDRLLFSISSIDVGDFLGELDENQWQFREGTTLGEIESSENPAMMWVKFKGVE